MAFRYGLVELCTAVKPFFLRRLLNEGHEQVVYLDPDVQVLAPLTEALEAGARRQPRPHSPPARASRERQLGTPRAPGRGLQPGLRGPAGRDGHAPPSRLVGRALPHPMPRGSRARPLRGPALDGPGSRIRAPALTCSGIPATTSAAGTSRSGRSPAPPKAPVPEESPSSSSIGAASTPSRPRPARALRGRRGRGRGAAAHPDAPLRARPARVRAGGVRALALLPRPAQRRPRDHPGAAGALPRAASGPLRRSFRCPRARDGFVAWARRSHPGGTLRGAARPRLGEPARAVGTRGRSAGPSLPRRGGSRDRARLADLARRLVPPARRGRGRAHDPGLDALRHATRPACGLPPGLRGGPRRPSLRGDPGRGSGTESGLSERGDREGLRALARHVARESAWSTSIALAPT